MDRFNEGREYADRVRPFNFLTVFPAKRISAADWLDLSEYPDSKNSKRRNYADLPRPVAPFNSNPKSAAANTFDRLTGDPVPVNRLKTYSEALADYHLHPEAKFLNGDYLDRGLTQRRHIAMAGVTYIGKEANRWEEQFHLGYDPEAQIEYDGGPEAIENFRARIREAVTELGQRKLAREAGVSREQIRSIIGGKAAPRNGTVTRLMAAIAALAR